MLYGRDYSHYSDMLDWTKEAKEINFAYAKASEGSGYRDNLFKAHVAGANTHNIPIGAYHYYLDSMDGRKQARFFWNVCSGSKLQLPPALDVETIGNKSLRAGNIFDCVDEIEKLFGTTPVIYTGYFVWRDEVKGDKSWAAGYPLWIAHYGVKAPLIPRPWKQWTFWQFSDANGDENWFNGDEKDLQNLSSGTNQAVETAVEEKPALVMKPTAINIAKEKFIYVWNEKKQKWIAKRKG
jgi:lysozyme